MQFNAISRYWKKKKKNNIGKQVPLLPNAELLQMNDNGICTFEEIWTESKEVSKIYMAFKPNRENIKLYAYVHLWGCSDVSDASAWNGQTHVISLELELQAVISYPVCLLGAKLKFCARACSYCRHIPKLPNMLGGKRW